MHRFVAFALALTVAGCGSAATGDTGDFPGEEGDIAELVGELSSAATSGDEQVVCNDLISTDLRNTIIGGDEELSCDGEMEKAIRDADGFLIDVEDVTIEEGGTEATAEVTSEQVGDDVTRTFSFVKEDDEWRIDSFG
jgi:hypothetical protein